MTKFSNKLIVDAGHPAVCIEVMDAGYRVRAKGYGRIEKSLPTGLYTVRYSAADAMEERDITLFPGDPVKVDHRPELPFASPAPLDLTSTSHEYHQQQAGRLSKAQPLARGEGAQLFIFVRDLELGNPGNPAASLTLHGLEGELLLALAEVAESSSENRSEASWAGCNIGLNPGTYRLRLQFDANKRIETAVTVCSGWQNQVFLFRRGGGFDSSDRPTPDLSGAAQLMAPISQGFKPRAGVMKGTVHPWEAGKDLRLAELARQALAHGWRAISTQDLSALLRGKWSDPLLGIFGLHLLLMKPEPDLALAEQVVERLREDILNRFQHPDVEALAAEICRLRGRHLELSSLDAPPMLRRSWQMLVAATSQQANLIGPNSLAARISDRLWGTGAWLIWEEPLKERSQARDDDWILPFLQGDREPSEQRGIINLPDRIIIGNMTLRKRKPDQSYESAEPQGETTTEIPLQTHGEVKIPAEESGVLKRGPGGEDTEAPDQLLVPHWDAMQERFNALSLELMHHTWGHQYGEVIRELSAELSFPAVRDLVERLLIKLEDKLGKLADRPPHEAMFDVAEYAILAQFEWILPSRTRPVPWTSGDPLSLSNLITGLGLPSERIKTAMAGILFKLFAVWGPRLSFSDDEKRVFVETISCLLGSRKQL
jgi:hypothetical protein